MKNLHESYKGRKISAEEFIEISKSLWGDRFDYSKVNYVNRTTKICLIDTYYNNAELWITPISHLQYKNPQHPIRTFQDFVNTATVKYGNKYDYSLAEKEFEGKKSSKRIPIINKETGNIFYQTVNRFLIKPHEFITKEVFIKEAEKIHNNFYNYSRVKFNGLKNKVEIVCPIHGSFWQAPDLHLKGQGCRKCGNKRAAEASSYTLRKFISKSKEIHGDKYDYSQTIYNGANNKIRIICPVHGPFEIPAYKHFQTKHKKGCPECEKQYQIETKKCEFLRRAKEIHGDYYDYSEIDYINNSTEVKIICPKHGVFYQKPTNHINNGHGCPQCGIERNAKSHTRPWDDVLNDFKKNHGDKYDYSLAKKDYINNSSKIDIICSKHGVFKQGVEEHLRGYGCPKCGRDRVADKLRMTQEEFIRRAREIHGDKYDYSRVDYKGSQSKIEIICPKHGSFWQVAGSHIYKGNNKDGLENEAGQGCPYCNESAGEKIISKFLNKNNIKYDRQRAFPNLRYTLPLKIDFYLPDYDIAIEYQGSQHYTYFNNFGDYEIFKKSQIRDLIKENYFQNSKTILLCIHYEDFNRIPFILDEILIKNNFKCLHNLKSYIR